MEDIFGVLNLSRKNEDTPFTADEVDVLTPLISNAAFTYESLNLSRKYHDSLKQLSIYSDILKILSYGLRKNELLQTIFPKFQEIVPFDTSAFLEILKEKIEGEAILEVTATIATNVYTNKTYRYAGSAVEEAIIRGSILFINDTSGLKNPFDQKIFNMSSVKEAFLAPLKVGGKVIGVAVFGCKIPGTIGNYEKQIEDIASILSIAFEKNLIYSSLYKRHQEMESIKQIGGILASSTFYQQEVLKHTIEMIQTIINVEACYLFLLEGEELKSKINYKLDQSVDMKDFDSIHIPLGKGIVGYTAARGESIIVQDVQRSRHFKPDFDLRPGINMRCVLCVPLISRGRVIGVIETLNKIDGNFDDNDLGLLQSIATSVSIALENSNLYQETLSMAEHERGIRNIFQKFVPSQVVDRIIHNAEEGTQLLEELKTVTFLNIDIRNFSNLSKKMGPQRTVSILNRFFAEMGGIIFNHNGIVDKYLGDGFLALFGAPITSSMDAENAIKAAIEMKERLASINNNLRAEISDPLLIGISIHTGEAVVGNIGFDKKMDYTVIGDSVNAVFRLQDLTKSRPNSILISEKTLQAVARPILDVQETGKCDLGSTLGELIIYELVGLKNPVEKDFSAGFPDQAGK